MRKWLSQLSGGRRSVRAKAGTGAMAAILDHERERLSSLLSAMEFGVLFTDAQDIVAYANPAFARLWPNAAPALGLPVHQAVPVPELLADGEAELADGRILTATVSPVFGPGDVEGGTLWIISDVTGARRATRDLMAAKEAAEAAARAKATFLATISREIRASLNGVIGMAGLLLDSRLGKRQQGYAHAVRVSAESLLVSLHDILDFARMDASGKLTLEEHVFEIRPLVEGVVDILGPRLDGRAVRMECHLGSEIVGEFLADSRRLRQVLANLAGNALKFTERGRVDITATIVPGDQGRDGLRLTVADTGVGIAPEAQAHLFERAGGSGLGLGVSKLIVEAMGGEIGFSSEPGKGTVFWFQVPVRRSLERRTSRTENLLAPGMRLLAVSEDTRFLDQAAPMLERLGVEAMVVPEAAAGLARLRQEVASGRRQAPLLLLDDRLSGLTATDMALLTRADPSLRAVVLALVGEDCGDAAQERAAGLGIRHLLARPIDPASLSALLQKLNGPAIERRAAESDAVVMRILVAEDNAINQQVAVGLLQKFGHHADVAGDGAAAVTMMEANGPYDLVLMDVQMPIMSGLDATRAIRAMAGPIGKVPIIAMTANAMRGDRELCLSVGMDDYIPKPIDRVKLAALLERWRPRA